MAPAGALAPRRGLAVALMLARYHIAADVAGGAAVGLAVGIALCRTALVGTGRVAQPR